MDKTEFEENLKEMYKISDKYDKETSSYFSIVDKKCEEKDFIDLFLTSQNIPITKESRFAIISKLVFLKNDPIIQHLKKENFSEEKIDQIKRNTYLWVKEFYEKRFEKFIKEIEAKNLLSKFYLEILKGVHKVGLEMNNLEIAWANHILVINKELENKFENKQKIMEYLRKNNLLDLGHHNIEADRCYSVLVKTKNGYEKKSYFEAFQETQKVIKELENFKNNLEKLDDEIYNQKKEYMDYLKVLIIAFSETNTNNLVFKWADADKAWMKITTPIQISHPFEYYDDAYRKSVSIEWDLRLKNLLLEKSQQKEKSKKMYEKLFKEIGKENHKEIYEKSKEHIEKVQLYLSKPILFYGSNLNGLASAQVIPNDLEISKIFGKKIFGFSDMILKQAREKPFTKLSKKIYEKDFLDESRKFLFNETEKWHKIYDFSTLGHEYGHPLWLDDDTEIKMNLKGEFKNIEEFKATMGGIISFFLNEEEGLKKEFLRDIIQRSIGLIAWMEQERYKPYYIEGLFLLNEFFETELLKFNGNKILIDLNSEEKYEQIKKKFYEIYKELAKNYLEKTDASNFLDNHLKIEGKIFLPRNKDAEKFVKYFYKKYQELGNQIDESVKKEDYILKNK